MKIRLDRNDSIAAIKNVNRVFLLSIVAFFTTGFTVGFITSNLNFGEVATSVLIEVTTYAALLMPVFIFSNLKCKGSDDVMFPTFDAKTLKNGTICAIIAYPAMLTATFLMGTTSVESQLTSDAMATTVINRSLIENVIRMALLPAVIEEFVFRGCLMGVYRKRNTICGIVVSSILFALMHCNLYQIPYAMVGGVIFAYVTFATDNVGTAMVAHFLVNLTSVGTAYLNDLITIYCPEYMTEIEGIVTGLMMTGGVLALGWLAISVFKGKIKTRPLEIDKTIGITDVMTASLVIALSIFILATCMFEGITI